MVKKKKKIQSSTVSFSDGNFTENKDLILSTSLLTRKPIQTTPALCKNIKILYKPYQWPEKCQDIYKEMCAKIVSLREQDKLQEESTL